MDHPKYIFLKNEFLPKLEQLKASQKGKWGVMNAQQMVEHFTDAVKNASGKLPLPILNEGEQLAKFRAFMLSEQPFKENTKNPMLAEQPASAQQPDMKSSIEELRNELLYFFEINEQHPAMVTDNAFFGQLNFEENIHLLHKHALHHLKQFGIE